MVILGVKKEQVITSVFGYQAVSMLLEGSTYLRAPGISESLKAAVIEVDFKKKQAILSEFSGAGDAVGKRRLVRVEPSDTLEVQIYDGRQRIQGTVRDISSEGISIITFFANIYGLKFKYDKKVFIDLKPPSTDKVVRSMGIISYMSSQEGAFWHRLGLRIYPTSEVKPLLDDYIARRQVEIMDEMEKKYVSMHGKKTRQR